MTTDVISKIGATNSPVTMDYTDLATWAAALPDLVALDQQWIGEVYNQGAVTVSSPGATLTGISGDSTHRVILRAATGASFRDHASAATNPLRYDNTVGASIEGAFNYNPLIPYGGYIWLEVGDLQFKKLGSGGGIACPDGRMVGCYFYNNIIDTEYGSGISHYVSSGTAHSDCTVENNVVFINTSGGSGALYAGNTGLARNNTLICTATSSAASAIATNYGATDCYNNAIFGFNAAIQIKPGGFGSNNATDCPDYSLSNVVGEGLTSVAFDATTFTSISIGNAGSDSGWNLRVPSGSALAGAGDSTDGSTTDIFGTTRSGTTPSIGAHELATVSGTTWSGSITETGSASDTPASAITSSRTVTEAGTASDSGNAVGLFARSITETGSASDTPASAITSSRTITETGTASDTQASAITSNRTITETGSASDTTTASAIFTGSVVETASANDAAITSAIVNNAIIETASASDATTATVTSLGVFAVSVVETASANDAAITSAIVNNAIIETASASDGQTVSAIINSTISEAGSASDATTAAITSLGVFAVSVIETLAANDTASTSAIVNNAVIEAGAALDQASAGAIYAATIVETASAVDSLDCARAILTLVSDIVVAADTSILVAGWATTVAEAGAASDAASVAARWSTAVSEAGSAGDSPFGSAIYHVSSGDLLTAMDGIEVGSVRLPPDFVPRYVLNVSAEDRRISVASEDRTLNVPVENRQVS